MKHWNPDEDLRRATRSRSKPGLPEGAGVGLLVTAAACVGFAILIYQLAGPRDIVGP